MKPYITKDDPGVITDEESIKKYGKAGHDFKEDLIKVIGNHLANIKPFILMQVLIDGAHSASEHVADEEIMILVAEFLVEVADKSRQIRMRNMQTQAKIVELVESVIDRKKCDDADCPVHGKQPTIQ